MAALQASESSRQTARTCCSGHRSAEWTTSSAAGSLSLTAFGDSTIATTFVARRLSPARWFCRTAGPPPASGRGKDPRAALATCCTRLGLDPARFRLSTVTATRAAYRERDPCRDCRYVGLAAGEPCRACRGRGYA